MNICLVGKYPPIQGGVSAQTFWTAEMLALLGHRVHVITNALSVEPGYRELILPSDATQIRKQYSYGKIECHYTQSLPMHDYIPWTQPFLSQLFGLALSVVEEHSCELMLGWYFEPYGLAATMVSQATKLPVILRHAGSDIGRLANNIQLRRSYKWMFDHMTTLLTSKQLSGRLVDLGVPLEKLTLLRPSRLPAVFSSDDVQKLPFDEISQLSQQWYQNLGLPSDLEVSVCRMLDKPFRRDRITIGIYGKIGHSKGTFDLLDALEDLAREGTDYNFVALSSGSIPSLRSFYQRITSSQYLRERTWPFPPLAPWRIPAFIKSCEIICFLEREFPIDIHSPCIPREVLSVGTCLVCSNEIVAKQPFKENLVSNKNVVVVDPKNHLDLAMKLKSLIEDDILRNAIAKHGQYLSRFYENEIATENATAEFINGFPASDQVRH